MSRPVDLLCLVPPLQGTGAINDQLLNKAAQGYRRSIRRIGGFWVAEFSILPGKNVPASYLVDWYENRLGHGFREKKAGTVTFDGIVWEMEMAIDGHKESKALDKVFNAVRTDYLDTAQEPQSTVWQVNQGSIDKYGRREQILYMDEIDATAAAALAKSELVSKGEVIPETVAIGPQVEKDGLHVTVVGKIFTANNRFITVADDTTGDVSDYVSDIITTDCDFLKVGRIQTNTLQVKRTLNEPKRAWDGLLELVALGDGTNPWLLYTDSDGYTHYEAASNIPRYEWRGRQGGLVSRMGAQSFWEFWPGVIRNVTRPKSVPAPGSFLSDGRDSWIMEVEIGDGFDAPELKPDGFDPEAISRAVATNQKILEEAAANE